MRSFQRAYAPYLTVLATILLVGCSSSPIAPPAGRQSTTGATTSPALPPAGSGRGGYYQDDGPGEKTPENLQAIPDAEPKIEPYSKRGNRPYVVFGKTYTPIVDDKPFKQRGLGSWYGKKFHGQKTSSGELYDMYKMTAAHPTLPLPSYARVTNIKNGRQVIVRVNDRGPFHSARIIDLSYTAALKLGYLGAGSTQLEVERLLPEDITRLEKEKQDRPAVVARAELVPSAAPLPTPPSAAQGAVETMLRKDANPLPTQQAINQTDNTAAKPAVISINTAAATTQTTTTGNFYIQVGAFSQAAFAESARSQFQQQWASNLPSVEVAQNGGLYRLFCGPFSSKDDAAVAAQKIQDGSTIKPVVVQR